MRELKKYIDEISDEFMSTFSQTGPNQMVNMMGSNEHEEVERIIKRVLGPETIVTFTKSHTFGSEDYDIYVVDLEFPKG